MKLRQDSPILAAEAGGLDREQRERMGRTCVFGRGPTEDAVRLHRQSGEGVWSGCDSRERCHCSLAWACLLGLLCLPFSFFFFFSSFFFPFFFLLFYFW